MCLDVSCHTVDNVSEGFTGVGLVSVVVDDGCRVNGAVCAERPEAFVPVDVARDVQVNSIFEEQSLKSISHGHLVAGDGSRVHGTMGTGNNPRGLRAIDCSKIGLHPLVLLVSRVVECVVTPALNVTEWA